MRTIGIIIVMAFGALIFGCGSSEGGSTSHTTPHYAKVMERAKKDAKKILSTDTCTMDREKAILESHVLAQRLRQAGDSAAADLYINEVRKLVNF